MREIYRTYEIVPQVLAQAMTIGWTLNVVILESDLTLQEREWYIQAVWQFGWSKLVLLEKIKLDVHLETVLDIPVEVCYTEENHTETEHVENDKDTFYLSWEYWYTGDFEITWQDVLEGCQRLLNLLRK